MRSVALIALIVSLTAAVCAPLSPPFDPDEGYYSATAAENAPVRLLLGPALQRRTPMGQTNPGIRADRSGLSRVR
jgi:hypothetical protein